MKAVFPAFQNLIHLAPAFFRYLFLALLGSWTRPTTPVGPLDLVNGCLPSASCSSSWPWALVFQRLPGTRRFMDAFKVPILIFLRQFFYGLGLFGGFFIPSQNPLEVAVYSGETGKKEHFTRHSIPKAQPLMEPAAPQDPYYGIWPLPGLRLRSRFFPLPWRSDQGLIFRRNDLFTNSCPFGCYLRDQLAHGISRSGTPTCSAANPFFATPIR